MKTIRKSTTARTMNYDAASGVLTVAEVLSKNRTQTDVYWVEEVYPDAGFGGRGFELRKHVRTADSGLYHVHVPAGGEASCDCRGHQYHGHCKHADAVTKLIGLGMLPDPRADADADVGATELAEQNDPADLQGGF